MVHSSDTPIQRRYAGREVVVVEQIGRCIHSRNCVLGRPDVFVPNAPGDWIVPDAAPASTVATLVIACPSGALRCEAPDGSEIEAMPAVNTIRTRENGPLEVRAEINLVGSPTTERETRATLCRCGQSRNKPFCDGSHVASGFVATGEPPSQPSEPLRSRDGELTVTSTRNGPLLVQGNLELIAASGRTLTRVRQAALCRCGASANKPFCDGSHVRIEFRSGDA